MLSDPEMELNQAVVECRCLRLPCLGTVWNNSINATFRDPEIAESLLFAREFAARIISSQPQQQEAGQELFEPNQACWSSHLRLIQSLLARLPRLPQLPQPPPAAMLAVWQAIASATAPLLEFSAALAGEQHLNAGAVLPLVHSVTDDMLCAHAQHSSANLTADPRVQLTEEEEGHSRELEQRIKLKLAEHLRAAYQVCSVWGSRRH